MLVAGVLYIVATPIGNLEDITHRALRVLREADLIACEDTRHTRRLLDHYGIDRPVISYHEHNEAARADDLAERLQAGGSIALVTDGGTPLISDPGYRAVHRAVEAGITVVSIPGPSAIVTALAGSGLPTDAFYFGGFLPARQGQRRRKLEQAKHLDCTLVFYEAPHRILEFLSDVEEILGARDLVIGRELTKIHEEWVRGVPADLIKDFASRPSIKGEITALVGKRREPDAPERSVQEALEAYLARGLSRMDAIKAVARERGVSKREIYAAVESVGDK